MNRYRRYGVALVLVILFVLFWMSALAQEGAHPMPCDFQQMESLQAAVDSSREDLRANPGTPDAQAAVEAAMLAYHDYVATCLTSSRSADVDLSGVTTATATEATCPARTLILYVDDRASGTGGGTSWTDAYRDLQTALAAADNTTSSYEIWAAAGTYKPTPGADRTATFQLKNCVALYGGFDGTESALTQRNWEANVTSLSGDTSTPDVDSDNIYHVVTGSGTDASAVLDGFFVTGGRAQGPWPHVAGGGMYNEGGSPTLANVTFSNNSADYAGGGMCGFDGSSPRMTNITFSNNSTGYDGGGMYNSDGSPTLTDVIFSDNSAERAAGGLYSRYGSPTLTHVFFSNNSGGPGGGMYNLGGNPALTDVTFSDNWADNGDGGGMYNEDSSPTLTNVFFSGNTAGGGGGMSNQDSSPTLTNIVFSGNTAGIGGGMSNHDSSPTLTNVTFSGNTAGFVGGGIYVAWGNPTLTNVTFANNTADNVGGGMYNLFSNSAIQNSIFWGNRPDQIADDPSAHSAVSYSDFEGGWPGTGNINADPRFVDAGSGDLRLKPFSPAINAGNNDYLPPNLTTDLDGNPRIVGGVVDMGAYEFPVESSLYLPAVAR